MAKRLAEPGGVPQAHKINPKGFEKKRASRARKKRIEDSEKNLPEYIGRR